MYCKFCGSRISLNTIKCGTCGANINLRDGGQTFFEDNELKAWMNDTVEYGNNTNMPKTTEVMKRTSLHKHSNMKSNNIKDSKTKKSFGSRGLTRSRLILCGISAVMLIVFLFVVFSIFNGTKDRDGVILLTSDKFAELSLEKRIEKVNGINLADEPVRFDDGCIEDAYMESSGVKITGYVIDDIEYVDLYDLIRGEKDSRLLEDFLEDAYKDVKTEKKDKKYVFEAKGDSGNKIIVEKAKKGTDEISIDASKSGDGKNVKKMEIDVIFVKNTEDSIPEIYVPIVEFLEKAGTGYTFKRNQN